MLEIPMIAKIDFKFDAALFVDSIIDCNIRVWKSDKDGDGDPEFNVHIDLPGEAFDQEWSIEIPAQKVLTEGVGGVITFAVDKVPDFPMKAAVVKMLKELTK